jgi:hypothetical protein
MKTEDKKKIKVKVKWVEMKERKSYTSISEQGQLIVTDMGESIYIVGTSLKSPDEPMKVIHFLIAKDGAKNLVEHLNEILEDK